MSKRRMTINVIKSGHYVVDDRDNVPLRGWVLRCREATAAEWAGDIVGSSASRPCQGICFSI